MFGQAPEMATADRGFFSAENERLAQSMGVNKVALPARGPLSGSRRQRQKQRWFRRAQRWRTGIEPRIATLKHVCAMARAAFKEEAGFKRYVGGCAIANNMVSIARFMLRRRARGKE